MHGREVRFAQALIRDSAQVRLSEDELKEWVLSALTLSCNKANSLSRYLLSQLLEQDLRSLTVSQFKRLKRSYTRSMSRHQEEAQGRFTTIRPERVL